eukprot:2984581-Amphidinium_carterae.1
MAAGEFQASGGHGMGICPHMVIKAVCTILACLVNKRVSHTIFGALETQCFVQTENRSKVEQ